MDKKAQKNIKPPKRTEEQITKILKSDSEDDTDMDKKYSGKLAERQKEIDSITVDDWPVGRFNPEGANLPMDDEDDELA
jgi:hypothetical protein